MSTKIMELADDYARDYYGTGVPDSQNEARAALQSAVEELEAQLKKWIALHEGTATLCEKRGKRVEELEAQLEHERVRLAGCGVAAMQNTGASKADRVKPGDYGYSASYGDVCNAVDREIELRSRLAEVKKQSDGAYLERNKLVALLSKVFPSGKAKTAIEGWSEDWHGCVYIDLPTGQASWHYHDSQAALFAHLPEYQGVWDGHTTDEKYERISEYASPVAAPAPPHECKTEAEKTAFAFGWWKAMEEVRKGVVRSKGRCKVRLPTPPTPVSVQVGSNPQVSFKPGKVEEYGRQCALAMREACAACCPLEDVKTPATRMADRIRALEIEE